MSDVHVAIVILLVVGWAFVIAGLCSAWGEARQWRHHKGQP